jgi:hypothetical protein
VSVRSPIEVTSVNTLRTLAMDADYPTCFVSLR